MSDRPNLMEIHARKLLGAPPEWKLFHYLAKDGGAGRRFFELRGAVCPDVFKSGPRKGQTNWSKRVDERQVLIPEDEHRAFETAWELETGLCRDCGDTGSVSAGWSASSGPRSRPCTTCNRSKP